jgi:hypothetical protein
LGNILIEACEGGVTTIGTVEAAARFFEKGMHIAKKYDHQRTRMLFLKGFSLIDMRKKRFTQGKKHIEEAERIAMENNFAEEVPFTLYLKARILHMMKKEKEATKAIRKASREAEKLNLKPLMKKIDALRMQIEEA